MSDHLDSYSASVNSGEEGSANPQNIPRHWPPAPWNPTRSSTRHSTDSHDARRQNLLDILRFERGQESARHRANAPPPSQPPTMSSSQASERRRRRAILRGIAAIRANRIPGTTFNPMTPQPSNAPASSSVSPRTLTPSDLYLQGGRPATRAGHRRADGLADLQQAGTRLTEASSDLRSLLDEPVPNIFNNLEAAEYSGEAEVNRRLKRRKLDSEVNHSGFPRVKYGHYGQVAPGQLKMEIVSCDGGNYPATEGTDHAYWAENVLRSDKTVYCTKIGKCNLVLRHQGETAFCLKKIVIKAPKAGFTAPVQEGMVFVSMSSENLVERTTPYQMQYPPPLSSLPPTPRTDPPAYFPEGSAFADATNENSFLNGGSSTTRDPAPVHPPPTRGGRFLYHPWSSRSRPRSSIDSYLRVGAINSSNNLIDTRAASVHFPDDETSDVLNPEVTIASHLPTTAQPFVVTNDQTSDDDPAGETDGFAAVTAAMDSSRRRELLALVGIDQRREADAAGVPSNDNEDDDPRTLAWETEQLLPFVGDSTPHIPKMPRRLTRPNEISWTAPALPPPVPSDRRIPTETARLGNDADEVLAPHARFFIREDKNKCSLEFDPPVSGRFILFKLWSPTPDENIDVQSITAYGFSGPRLFPASEMM